VSIKRQITINPVFGEIAERLAPAVISNEELRFGLRECFNCLITRNLEIASRPPTHDMGALPDDGGSTCRSFQFRFTSGTHAGKFTVITFSPLKLVQHVVAGEDTFTPITTTWTADDILAMDGCQHEEDMIFVTPAKEPMVLTYTTAPTYAWATLESIKTGVNPSPWYTAGTWPLSISFMIGRMIAVYTRKYYGSEAGDVLNWDITTKSVDGETLVLAASGFSFDAADDLDSGFHWIKGGTLAFGGSSAGVWMLSNYTDGLNASNPNIKNYSTVGTYNVKAEDVQGGMAFFSADGKTLKIFAVTPEGPINLEINKYSKHLFEESPPLRMVYMRTPDSILWILREDGVLIAFCIDDTRKAWCRVVTDIDPMEEEYLGDSQIKDEAPPAKTPTAEANDGTGGGEYTITGHGWTGAELVRLIGLGEEDYGHVVVVDANTIQIELPSQNYLPYGTGIDFQVRDATFDTTVAHFANKTLDVLQDGSLSVITADAAGKVTLATPGSDIIVSIPYYSYIQPQSFMDIHGFDRGTVNKIQPRVYKTNALLYGETSLDSEDLKSKHIDSDGYSGVVPDLPIGGGVDYDCSYRVGSRGSPFILVSCVAEISVGEN
jgi:hypothetical protein